MTFLRPKNAPLLALLLCVGGTAAGQAPRIDRGSWLIRRELLPQIQDGSKRIELFWTKPEGNGPFPAILYIHGHQETVRNGGQTFVESGRLGTMASRGYVAAAVSQPGYGNSSGPPDFCGPVTQSAVGGDRFSATTGFCQPK
jgi:hypothetical protein